MKKRRPDVLGPPHGTIWTNLQSLTTGPAFEFLILVVLGCPGSKRVEQRNLTTRPWYGAPSFCEKSGPWVLTRNNAVSDTSGNFPIGFSSVCVHLFTTKKIFFSYFNLSIWQPNKLVVISTRFFDHDTTPKGKISHRWKPRPLFTD